MTAIDAAAAYYDINYDFIGQWFLRPEIKIKLGPDRPTLCRFCGQGPSEVTFRPEAHALPEAIGNKSLTTTYECYVCNQAFGRGIENEFRNWSKPMRTFARIRGKSGVPSLKKGSSGGWRIDYGTNTGFVVNEYEDDPIFDLDEATKTITFRLRRDTYVPIAVLKTFVKMGLTLMPEAEMSNFTEALAWIRETGHTVRFVKKGEFPVLYTFQPGPMPNDLIAVFLLRRKASVATVPYAFLVLAYGNEVFQVCLPSPERDAALSGRTLNMIAFPAPGHPDAEKYGVPRTETLDLTGTQPVKGEVFSIGMGLEGLRGGPNAPNSTPTSEPSTSRYPPARFGRLALLVGAAIVELVALAVWLAA